jgi:transcriptional regulator GlxA family with amidase domain
MRIDILLFDGFDELDAIGPYEVLQNAAGGGADFVVRLVSSSGAREVVAAHGLRVTVEARIGEGPPPDLIVVPGGGWNARSAAGAWAEAERGEIPSRLAELHQAGTKIAAVCTGAMLVAAAGLLGGRTAITHQGAIEDLRAAGAEIVEARVVDDGDVITAGGVTSGLDLALWLVERFAGVSVAQAVEREMEYDRRDIVWRQTAI